MSGFNKFITTILLITSITFGWLYFNEPDDIFDAYKENEELKETVTVLRESLGDRYDAGYDSGYGVGFNVGYDKGYADATNTTPNYYPYSEENYQDTLESSTAVYITETGSKYHQSWCSYLRESSIEISLSDAQSWGYDACSRCW